ncbi:MAG: hypothetical protein AAFR96_07735 [Planctomycetota bacterium]
MTSTPATVTHLMQAIHAGEIPGFGRFVSTNPAESFSARTPHAGRVIAWAGWLDDAKADPEAGTFEPDFQVWTDAGWSALRSELAAGHPHRVEAGGTICLRPHARCVVSDPQSCLTFLRDDPPSSVEILYDPVAMLTPDMLEHVEDHLARAFEAAAEMPADRLAGCVVAAPRLEAGRVVHAALAEFPKLGGFIREAWAASPLASRPLLVTDRRDAEG